MPGMESARGLSIVEILVVMAIFAIVAAMAVPMTRNAIGDMRLRGDARSLNNAMSLTKMRAASDFTNARLYLALDSNSFHIETWQKTGPAWVTEGGTTQLAGSDTFGYGVVSAPPPNTQAAIGQAAQCRTAAGAVIGNTACVVFNSRGIPVDATGAPTGAGALYLTDNTAVYGITVSASGLIKLWRTNPTTTPGWSLQ
jgi:prepilin-type N-terminal cleavage/methylation domain-containing protein